MKGDFSKLGFAKAKHFTRVNMQQGRLQLDRDWNEQQDIIDHRLNTQLQDVVGIHGTPKGNTGFQIVVNETNIEVQPGRYYVNGVFCENEQSCLFTDQPYIKGLSLPTEDGDYVFYLDTWQQSINYIHDQELLDLALDGTDTTTRQQTMWQVHYQKLEADSGAVAKARQALLDARRIVPSTILNITQSQSAYTNHLLRLEVHQVNTADSTFGIKWDLENARRLARVVSTPEESSGNVSVQLELGKHNLEPKVDQWVEIRTQNQEYADQAGIMAKIQNFDVYSQKLILSELSAAQISALTIDSGSTLFIRQWTGFEQNVSSNTVKQLKDTDISITLDSLPQAGVYWHVAMRQGYRLDHQLHPNITEHQYASLAKVSKMGTAFDVVAEDRYEFTPLSGLEGLKRDGDTMEGAFVVEPSTLKENQSALEVRADTANILARFVNQGTGNLAVFANASGDVVQVRNDGALEAKSLLVSQMQVGDASLNQYVLQDVIDYIASINRQALSEQALSRMTPLVLATDGTYVIDQSGLLWISGANTAGRLGNGSDTGNTYSWTNLPEVPQLLSLVKGTDCAYAITYTGKLWVTGANAEGQLGLGDTTPRLSWEKVFGLAEVKTLVTDTNSAYLLSEAGELWVTGNNSKGQLGTGDTANLNSWQKVNISGLVNLNTLVAADQSAYAITTDGVLWVTGLNDQGQLGTGDTIDLSTWQQISVSGFTEVSEVFVANGSTYALTAYGDIWVTGNNAKGQLGTGDTTSIHAWQKISAITGVTSLIAVTDSAYALTEYGELWVTGLNDLGQLGTGDKVDVTGWQNIVTVGFTGIKQLLASEKSVYALTSDGDIWVTGRNTQGQLGTGDTTDLQTWTKIAVEGLAQVSTLTTASGSAYAVTTDGGLWVTGNNASGQLGLGDTNTIHTWQQTALEKVTLVAANGDASAYAITENTRLWVAGADADAAGALGSGTKANILSWTQMPLRLYAPTPAASTSEIKKRVLEDRISAIAVNYDNSFYSIDEGGDLWITGKNTYGQLGRGNTDDIEAWEKAPEITATSKVKKLVSYNAAVYAVTEDGKLWVTGKNDQGQLGIGNNSKVTIWKTLESPTQVSEIYDYGASVYALTETGNLWVTGNNADGQLGLGDSTARNTWQQIVSVGQVNQLVNRANSVYLVTTDGELWVCGKNSAGQLGIGSSPNPLENWQQIPKATLGTVRKLVLGYDNAYVLNDVGQLWVTGFNNYGQLGTGNTSTVYSWQQITVTGLSAVKTLVDYDKSMYLITEAGELWVCGKNDLGQLGTGNNASEYKWKQPTDLTQIKISQVLAYDDSIYAITEGGDLWVTGKNDQGQLGAGSSSNLNQWQRVANISKVSSIQSYDSSVYALTTAGDLWVTGKNDLYQLGTGNNTKVETWQKMTDFAGVSKIMNNNQSFYLITQAGELWITGKNDAGQLGTGNTSSVTKWTQVGTESVAGPTKLTELFNLDNSVYVLTQENKLWVTGKNDQYQLGSGNGDTTDVLAWTEIQEIADISKIMLCYRSVFVITAAGELWVSGENSYGQLGVGNTSDVSVWQKVPVTL